MKHLVRTSFNDWVPVVFVFTRDTTAAVRWLFGCCMFKQRLGVCECAYESPCGYIQSYYPFIPRINMKFHNNLLPQSYATSCPGQFVPNVSFDDSMW